MTNPVSIVVVCYTSLINTLLIYTGFLHHSFLLSSNGKSDWSTIGYVFLVFFIDFSVPNNS